MASSSGSSVSLRPYFSRSGKENSDRQNLLSNDDDQDETDETILNGLQCSSFMLSHDGYSSKGAPGDYLKMTADHETSGSSGSGTTCGSSTHTSDADNGGYSCKDTPSDYLKVSSEHAVSGSRGSGTSSVSSIHTSDTTNGGYSCKVPPADYLKVASEHTPLGSRGSGASSVTSIHTASIREPKPPLDGGISASFGSIVTSVIPAPAQNEWQSESEETSLCAHNQPPTTELAADVNVTSELAKVAVGIYTGQGLTQIEIVVPIVRKRTPESVEIPTRADRPLIDPKTVRKDALIKCKIAPPYESMFGLWNTKSNDWIILSEPIGVNVQWELRIRFTFNATDGEQTACRVQKMATREEKHPLMSAAVILYLFHQRRNHFLKHYPKPKDSCRWMNYILPDLSNQEPNLQGDDVLIAALFDLFRKELEVGHRIKVDDPIKLLPVSSLKSFKSHGCVQRMWEVLGWGDKHVVRQRFRWILKSFAGLVENKEMEFYCKKYITHVESREPLFNTEIFHLADDIGAISVNGDRGVIVAIDEDKIRDVVTTENYGNEDIGMRVETSENHPSIVQLDFIHIADMTIFPEEEKEICHIFMSDILGRHINLTFANTKAAISFAECVNGYRNLLGGLPVTSVGRGRVHGLVTKMFLHQKLTSHPSKRASALGECTTTFGDYILMIKFPGNDGKSAFQCSIISKVIGGYLVRVESPSILLPAASIDDVIKTLASDTFKDEFGDEVIEALNNVIEPNFTDVSTLVVKRVCDFKEVASEDLKMEGIAERDIAHFPTIPDLGMFTKKSVRDYSGRINDSHRHCVGKKRVLLIRVDLKDNARAKEHLYTEMLESSMNMLFKVRHHWHVIRQLGVTNGLQSDTSKVLEHSEWGTLLDYFGERAILGKRGENDQGAITGYWLLQIFYQLAHVLNYLEYKNIPHGNICAENIILSRISPTPFMKLSHPGVVERPSVSTIDDDKMWFATTICEIEHAAKTGEKSENMRRPKIPDWLRIPDQATRHSTKEDIGNLLRRCWCKKANHRPSFREILQSFAIMLHHDVGKDEYFEIETPNREPEGLLMAQKSFQDKDIKFKKELGKGNYGIVSLCEYKNETFAVKDMICLNRKSQCLFFRELKTMLKIKHPNIVEIKGVTLPTYRIVMDYYKMGSLAEITMTTKGLKNFPNFPRKDIVVLLNLSLDIALGLQELHRLRIQHRDLALRNILVKEENDRYVAMISDFGLARFTKKNCYNDNELLEFPAPWYPPESLEEGAGVVFKFESDIWSYGVTIWELFAGKPPDYRCDLRHLLANLKQGLRLLKPDLCPDKVYDEIIRECWMFKPSNRITIPNIIKRLQREIHLPGLAH